MRERKERHRLEARRARRAIPVGLRREKEMRIREQVHKLPEVRDARIVGCYVGVHSEVDTRVLIEELIERDLRVAVPLVTPPDTMRLAPIASLADLRPGAHGIPEPPRDAPLLPEVDAMIVPGLLFTTDGHRLGNGGGYFDRLLRAMPRARRVGIAYDEQVVPELPVEEHDVAMDVVVTEARVLRASARP